MATTLPDQPAARTDGGPVLEVKNLTVEFPTDDACAVDGGTAVRVPIDLGQSAEIDAYFDSRDPDGSTPAQLALAAASASTSTHGRCSGSSASPAAARA